MCHIQTLKPQLAVADLKKVMALEPHNNQVKLQLESTQKLLRKIEFEKVAYMLHIECLCPSILSTQAIEVGEEQSAVERCLEIIADGLYHHDISIQELTSTFIYVVAILTTNTTGLNWRRLKTGNTR